MQMDKLPEQIMKRIEELEKAGYCTGCGHRADNFPMGLNKKGEPYLACCPDSDYVVKLSLAKKLATAEATLSQVLLEALEKISTGEMPYHDSIKLAFQAIAIYNQTKEG